MRYNGYQTLKRDPFRFPYGSKYPIIIGIWDIGNSNYSTDFGLVYDRWVLGPLGFGVRL